MSDCHYVYVHRNPATGAPFYVGKGSGNNYRRSREKAARSDLWKMMTKHSDPHIEIVATNLPEDAAFELESFLISQIGRQDLGDGTLINRTDGGIGMAGYITPVSTRLKISKTMGWLCASKEWRERQSKVKKKIWENPRHRAKYLGSNNCNARAVICLDTGEVFGSVAEAAKAYGKNPRGSTISRVCRGAAKTYLGKRWAYLGEAEKAGGSDA